MKVLEAGHIYELASLDGELEQILTFVKRGKDADKYPGNTDSHPGTTVQDVIRALINRMRYVNDQIPATESLCVIDLLRQCLLLLELRAARRKNRTLGELTLDQIEREKPCETCGHIRCGEHGIIQRELELAGRDPLQSRTEGNS